ncbi:Wzz/FepE/Etk N-terminal domain-containing protein [Algoriphagus sp. AGSA1]|uniref:Wzz/FepE/Etk N-terminal domain-containing protein n=1 Tax=Algoriphagus sp. AGSA1 TaxID=2907213 RepID=UPI001F40403C|nr:Wzz/FepE/Etk N-terminal domain-containing protein [Algoriphagus sp. AGSA1]MCE7055299.1 Wzz/FepE/Etk N-terminal domain-containing protein [Algoriphagus sp. AGSA1]
MKKFESEDKISVINVLRAIYRSKITLIISLSIFISMGLIYYILSPKEYSSRVVLLPEVNSSGSGISGLASLAGINIGRMDGKERSLSSNVYEPIIRSSPFLEKILKTEFEFPNLGQSMALIDYFRFHSEPSFGDKVENLVKFRWFKSSEVTDVQLVELDTMSLSDTSNSPIFTNSILKVASKKIVKDFSERIYYSIDMQNGLITISLDLQDPDVGAEVLQKIVSDLIFITRKYQGQKDSTSIGQLDKQIVEKRGEYEKAMNSLAKFRDQNFNLIRSVDKIEEQRLENEISFAFNIYNSLLQQREQVSIQSQNIQDPIAIIEPVQIPTSYYSPNILKIMVICIFFGLLVGVSFVLIKKSILVIIN